MNLSEFRIGLEFYCGDKRWRCTDVGSRVAIAICLEPVSVGPGRPDPDRPGEYITYQSDDQSWFNGPPYAVSETVFDEDDMEACTLDPDLD
ncbi:MAG: hypothetical protein H6953_19530 [Chromatiaceae bacterium]|nr:hypothetical protein [Chromatiaceae bacterium]